MQRLGAMLVEAELLRSVRLLRWSPVLWSSVGMAPRLAASLVTTRKLGGLRPLFLDNKSTFALCRFVQLLRTTLVHYAPHCRKAVSFESPLAGLKGHVMDEKKDPLFAAMFITLDRAAESQSRNINTIHYRRRGFGARILLTQRDQLVLRVLPGHRGHVGLLRGAKLKQIRATVGVDDQIAHKVRPRGRVARRRLLVHFECLPGRTNRPESEAKPTYSEHLGSNAIDPYQTGSLYRGLIIVIIELCRHPVEEIGVPQSLCTELTVLSAARSAIVDFGCHAARGSQRLLELRHLLDRHEVILAVFVGKADDAVAVGDIDPFGVRPERIERDPEWLVEAAGENFVFGRRGAARGDPKDTYCVGRAVGDKQVAVRSRRQPSLSAVFRFHPRLRRRTRWHSPAQRGRRPLSLRCYAFKRSIRVGRAGASRSSTERYRQGLFIQERIR
jgi:hypothetical protein